jgi:hypothetical protein
MIGLLYQEENAPGTFQALEVNFSGTIADFTKKPVLEIIIQSEANLHRAIELAEGNILICSENKLMLYKQSNTKNCQECSVFSGTVGCYERLPHK